MNVRMMLLALLVALTTAEPAAALSPVTLPLTVNDNEATASVALPGDYGLDLTITFEQVVGLNPAALVVTASVILPTDTSVLTRLPSSAPPPDGFPVLIEITPAPGSALSFSGVVTVAFHTHNLSLRTDAALSLFSSSNGGPFRDITRYEGIGSYRAGGSSGGFSEFLIVRDRRALDGVVEAKFSALRAALDGYSGSMPPTVYAGLDAQVDQAYSYWQLGNMSGAISEVAAFEASVRTQSGAVIPDVWRAHDASVVNVAGQLRSIAYTLKFSLERKTSRLP